MEHLPNNAVKIYNDSIVIGTGIANFFRKRGMTHVSIILDYKHQSIILWGNTNNNNKTTNTLGYRILYSGMITRQVEGIRLPMIAARISKYIDPLAYFYTAKPLNEYAIIFNNVLLTGPELIGQTTFSNMNEQYIILGKPALGYDIKPEDLIRKERKLPASQSSSQTQQTSSQSLSSTNAQTPNISTQTPQTQIQSPNIKSHKTPKHPALKPQTALETHNNDKQTGEHNDEQHTQNMPTSEEIEQAENEYKKMILGE
jgi:hypothetical protein